MKFASIEDRIKAFDSFMGDQYGNTRINNWLIVNGFFTAPASVNKYPTVLWTHTADMIASHVLGV